MTEVLHIDQMGCYEYSRLTCGLLTYDLNPDFLEKDIYCSLTVITNH